MTICAWPARHCPRSRRLPGAGAAAVALLAATLGGMLQGCSDLVGVSDIEAVRLGTPAERHPIGFRSGRARLDVELPPGGAGFSTNQQTDVLAFLDRYVAEGTSSLRLSVPGTSRGNATVRHVRALAEEAGVAMPAIRVERHATHGAEVQVVRLSYSRREVAAPECGDYSEDLGQNRERVHYPNFGCATQRNLALTVADPRDLLQPKPAQPPSSEHRSVNWTKYVGVPVGTPGAAVDSGAKAGAKAGPAGAAAAK